VNRLTIRADRLKRLRELCLSFPEATEKVAWGDPTWRVRKRIFAMQKGNYEGGRPSVWLKGGEGAQAMLVQADPARFFVPGYVGNKGWIGIYLDGPVDWGMVGDLVTESYRLIAPVRLVASLTEASGPKRRAGRRRK
jgi:predicted DNA-binding protein (MmcQ/YjbR family)